LTIYRAGLAGKPPTNNLSQSIEIPQEFFQCLFPFNKKAVKSRLKLNYCPVKRKNVKLLFGQTRLSIRAENL
jgi:hypothetical protein